MSASTQAAAVSAQVATNSPHWNALKSPDTARGAHTSTAQAHLQRRGEIGAAGEVRPADGPPQPLGHQRRGQMQIEEMRQPERDQRQRAKFLVLLLKDVNAPALIPVK